MNQDNLFRLALVTHTSAPSTLNKYISLLSKITLFDSKYIYATAYDISNFIKTAYEIEFSRTEISYTLDNDDDFMFNSKNQMYSLKPEAIEEIKTFNKSYSSFDTILDLFVNIFYKSSNAQERDNIIELIKKYVYYSFNEGKKALLSLICEQEAEVSEEFKATNEEKEIINNFLNWHYPQKDEEIFGIVSYCIDYGMITSKRDPSSVGTDLFNNTIFYLDANIVFRLMGLNGKERQKVTLHFLKRCAEVNIQICYTNFTLDEVNYAIDKLVNHARLINEGNDRPFDLEDIRSLGDYENLETYEVYYDWTRQKGNFFRSYDSYKSYLIELAHDCISPFTLERGISSSFGESSQLFSELAVDLRDYKNNRSTNKEFKLHSTQIDVENFLYVKNKKNSCNDPNCYIISADRRFYDWSVLTLPSIPLVFLPSEWLSIILKYTTRTKEDYKSFNKLMNLRITVEGTSREVISARVTSLKELTTDVDIKKKMLIQISQFNPIANKSEEWIQEEKRAMKKAFDNILDDQKREMHSKFEKTIKVKETEIEELQKKHSQELEDTKESSYKQGKQDVIESEINKRVDKWKKCAGRKIDVPVALVSFVILLCIIFVGKVNGKFLELCSKNEMLIGNELTFAVLLSSTLAVIIAVIVGVAVHYTVKYLGSDSRKKKLIKEAKEKNI